MEIGRSRARVVRNAIEIVNDKSAVVLYVTVGEQDESNKILIWLTDKALGIARRHLKTCGFDPDKEELGVLIDNPERLKGKELDVLVEQKGNYFNVSLPLGNAAPSKTEVARLGAGLRSVKKVEEEPPAPNAPDPCPKHKDTCALDCVERVPF